MCGECGAPLSGSASFVWGTVLYNPDGSVHYCEEKETA
jgi:hypothetical protein